MICSGVLDLNYVDKNIALLEQLKKSLMSREYLRSYDRASAQKDRGNKNKV